MIDLDRLQKEQAEWSFRNFGPKYGSGYRPLLGVGEEVGELMHAHLKDEQGIRGNEDHVAAKMDAVGDILIYLADYCTGQGFKMSECLEKAWNEVKARDWTKNRESGV